MRREAEWEGSEIETGSDGRGGWEDNETHHQRVMSQLVMTASRRCSLGIVAATLFTAATPTMCPHPLTSPLWLLCASLR